MRPARVKSIAGHRRELLRAGWELCSTAPDAICGPEELSRAALQWLPAHAPSTAAACLRSAKTWSLDAPTRRFDAEDWWYRARFPAPSREPHEELVLGFDGLATVADVWLNGTPLLTSDNMFLAHERVLDAPLRPDNELVIRFRALDKQLEARRPRPKWRAPMVENQQLRWFRTTLLGRTPGWSPPAAAVGPWRAVWLETRARVRLTDLALHTGVDGVHGWVDIAATIEAIGAGAVGHAALVVSRGTERRHAIPLQRIPNSDTYSGRLEVPDVALWWPHTHGEPSLYDARLTIKRAGADSGGPDSGGPDSELDIDLGRIGFRTITLDTTAGDFSVRVNDTPIFCRGACWTPPDPVSLDTPAETAGEVIAQVRAAGLNMLRVGGTMVYESAAFLDACDANGILLWADFMFANMSYPEGDPAFAASVAAEARQQLARLAGRPCLALLCGNSEGEQQAAMWGAPRESWSPPLFQQQLAQLATHYRPDVPYWPSSAHGGNFPHEGNTGTTSYYGVGAYLRPLEDARRAEIRFASECLAFANIPEDSTLARMPGGPSIRCHHPAWKMRTPRDLGAGWDFDDVRDHYLARLFGVNPLELRYGDHDRYAALSRVVTGEVMERAFAEWRRKRSTCRGALIWFYRDLWCGAGWGIVDALGTPKAPYYYIRRVSQPIALSISDEGGNGLYLHVTNEHATELAATLELKLYRAGEVSVGNASRAVTVAPRETAEIAAAALFDGFLDLSYAYRFGPPPHDLVVASLMDETKVVLAQAFHFVHGLPATRELDIGLSATATPIASGATPAFEVSIATRRFAQSVWIEAEGYVADDAYFHVAPGTAKTILLRRGAPAGDSLADRSVTHRPLRGRVHALNAHNAAKIELRS
jgi:beta-mannosidase